MSDCPKCKDLEVTYWRCSPIQESTTGGFFQEEDRHIFFMEDNLLHAISTLRHVMCSFMLVLKFLI